MSTSSKDRRTKDVSYERVQNRWDAAPKHPDDDHLGYESVLLDVLEFDNTEDHGREWFAFFPVTSAGREDEDAIVVRKDVVADLGKWR